MTPEEREKIVRRIILGKVVARVKNHLDKDVEIEICDPTLPLLAQADRIYQESLDQALSDGLIGKPDIQDHLEQYGLWSAAKQSKLDRLLSDIETLRKELGSMEFKLARKESITEQIANMKSEISSLESSKHSLDNITAEYYAHKIKEYYVYSRSIYDTNGNQILADDDTFVNKCRDIYVENTYLTDSQIREIARTDPWRIYWNVAKSSVGQLFNKQIVDFTDLQLRVCTWSRIYDSVYDSYDRPPDFIIDNDEALDQWFIKKSEDSQRDRNKNYAEQGLKNKDGKTMTFVMADEKGAKKVYDLNDQHTRNTIKAREKKLLEKGTLDETYMPDTQMELRMQAVNQARR